MYSDLTYLTICLKRTRDLVVHWSSSEAVDEGEAVFPVALNHEDGGRAIGEFDEMHDVEFDLRPGGGSD